MENNLRHSAKGSLDAYDVTFSLTRAGAEVCWTPDEGVVLQTQTQLPEDDGLVHESQSSETVIDDIMTDVNVLRMEDGRVDLSHPGRHKDQELDADAKGNPRDHEHTTER